MPSKQSNRSHAHITKAQMRWWNAGTLHRYMLVYCRRYDKINKITIWPHLKYFAHKQRLQCDFMQCNAMQHNVWLATLSLCIYGNRKRIKMNAKLAMCVKNIYSWCSFGWNLNITTCRFVSGTNECTINFRIAIHAYHVLSSTYYQHIP